MHLRWRVFGGAVMLVFVADQITKLWARAALVNGPMAVIDNLFDFHLAYNTGSAFSMLTGQRSLLTAAAFVIIAIIAWTVYKERDAPGYQIAAYGIIVGGAIGNLVDRIAFGKVTDFILWRYHDLHWPVFNVADACLCVGAGLLLLGWWRSRALNAPEGQVPA